jgi:chlorobactene glucosyltransferase
MCGLRPPSSAVAAALTERLDLLSLAPRQELRSFAERLILPCGLILLSFLQVLRQAQARYSKDVTATGQFLLVRRAAYEAVGGHAAVRTSICEDLELARLLKQSGRAVLLMGAEELLSARMYTGWRTLWPGLAKNLVDTLGGPAATLWVAFAAVVLAWAAYLAPLIDLAGCMRGAWSRARAADRGRRLGRGHRLAYCSYILFPHTFLVRSPLPARLYGGGADSAR